MEDVKYSEMPVFGDVQPSGWECELFGTGSHGITLRPKKGHVPNAFWRLMQFIVFGNRWKRVK